MFGVLKKDLTFCLALNHLVILGKYFLCVNALNNNFFVFKGSLSHGDALRASVEVSQESKPPLIVVCLHLVLNPSQ